MANVQKRLRHERLSKLGEIHIYLYSLTKRQSLFFIQEKLERLQVKRKCTQLLVGFVDPLCFFMIVSDFKSSSTSSLDFFSINIGLFTLSLAISLLPDLCLTVLRLNTQSS